jgi:hypothetical protein
MRELRRRKISCIYGDIAHADTLAHAGVADAEIVISSVPDSLLKGTSNEKIVRHVRMVNPSAKIIATVDVLAEAEMLYAAGADYVTIARLDQANELVEAVTAAESGLLDDMRARLEAQLRDRQEILLVECAPPSGRREFILPSRNQRQAERKSLQLRREPRGAWAKPQSSNTNRMKREAMKDALVKMIVAKPRLAKRPSTSIPSTTYRVSKAQSLRLRAFDLRAEAAEAKKAKAEAGRRSPQKAGTPHGRIRKTVTERDLGGAHRYGRPSPPNNPSAALDVFQPSCRRKLSPKRLRNSSRMARALHVDLARHLDRRVAP